MMRTLLLLVLASYATSTILGAMSFSVFEWLSQRIPRFLAWIDFQLCGFMTALFVGTVLTILLTVKGGYPYMINSFWIMMGGMLFSGLGWSFMHYRGFNLVHLTNVRER